MPSYCFLHGFHWHHKAGVGVASPFHEQWGEFGLSTKPPLTPLKGGGEGALVPQQKGGSPDSLCALCWHLKSGVGFLTSQIPAQPSLTTQQEWSVQGAGTAGSEWKSSLPTPPLLIWEGVRPQFVLFVWMWAVIFWFPFFLTLSVEKNRLS